MPQLIILHTCDLHGQFSEPRANAISHLRRSRPSSFLFDCGDALGIGNLNPGLGSDNTLQRMSGAGYNALAMGNREAHLWWWAVRRKLKGARFAVLSSNLRDPHPPVQREIVISSGCGVTVGAIALTPAMVRPGTMASRFTTVIFDDPVGVAREIAQRLRPQVDVLIALSHLGREADRRLAMTAPAIDLILGGHDHSPGLPEGERVRRTLLARSSPYGRNIGEVTVEVDDGAKPRRVSCVAKLLDLPE